MLKKFQKHELDSLESALAQSIEQAHTLLRYDCEKVCLCVCLLAGYFSNKLERKMQDEMLCNLFWKHIVDEFYFEIKENLLLEVTQLKEKNLKMTFENLKQKYCVS